MVEGMPRLSALLLSGVVCGNSLTAFLHAAQHDLQMRPITIVVGISARLVGTVDPALLTACFPHLQGFQGGLPYACGARCLRALARACRLQELICSLDQCDEATAAAIGACTTLRSLKLEFERHPGTEEADISSTETGVGGLLLPALVGLTRLTSLEVASKEVEAPNLDLRWPALAPLAALTALQRLRLSWWGLFDNDLSACLSQLPAGSLGALTQLHLYGSSIAGVCGRRRPRGPCTGCPCAPGAGSRQGCGLG